MNEQPVVEMGSSKQDYFKCPLRKVELHEQIHELDAHLFRAQFRSGVGIVEVEEAGYLLLLFIDEQGALPAEVDALAAQACQVYAVFLKGDVQSRHLFHELGEAAVHSRAPHLHQPYIVLPVRAQLSKRILAALRQRQTGRSRDGQIAVPDAGAGPSVPNLVFIEGVDGEVGMGEAQPIVRFQPVDRHQ